MADWWEDHITQATVTAQRPTGRPGELSEHAVRQIRVMGHMCGEVGKFVYGGTMVVPWEIPDDD